MSRLICNVQRQNGSVNMHRFHCSCVRVRVQLNVVHVHWRPQFENPNSALIGGKPTATDGDHKPTVLYLAAAAIRLWNLELANLISLENRGLP